MTNKEVENIIIQLTRGDCKRCIHAKMQPGDHPCYKCFGDDKWEMDWEKIKHIYKKKDEVNKMEDKECDNCVYQGQNPGLAPCYGCVDSRNWIKKEPKMTYEEINADLIKDYNLLKDQINDPDNTIGYVAENGKRIIASAGVFKDHPKYFSLDNNLRGLKDISDDEYITFHDSKFELINGYFCNEDLMPLNKILIFKTKKNAVDWLMGDE